METVEVCGHRILLKPVFDSNEIEDGPLKGFRTESDEDHKRSKAATIVGEVVGIGSTAWRAFDGNDPKWKPWAKVGDKVYFARRAGEFITVNGDDMILLNDADVQAIIHEEDE
jgi:co-chaperonin GroES (HSP10)